MLVAQGMVIQSVEHWVPTKLPALPDVPDIENDRGVREAAG